MADPLGMVSQLAANTLRFGWYSGINWALERAADGQRAPPSGYKPKRPVPSRNAMFAELRRLMVQDAAAVRDGLYPPSTEMPGRMSDHFRRVQAMFRDLPEAIKRRQQKETDTARNVLDAVEKDAELPDYFVQDFHFQADGYLSEDSARLYDIQVETLFYGSAELMRRAALRPIAEALKGRDQRRHCLLDVACGTGRFLRDIRLTFPGLPLTGLDLSQAYLREACEHMRGLRPAKWLAGNAEEISLPDQSQDVVTTVFLFHELPPEVRRQVAREMTRVLKPGGTLVFVDSLQMGDRPDWDGLLEAFPVRFHEPYFRSYAIDDLKNVFESTGLRCQTTELAFLSKVLVFQKP